MNSECVRFSTFERELAYLTLVQIQDKNVFIESTISKNVHRGVKQSMASKLIISDEYLALTAIQGDVGDSYDAC